MRYQIVHNNPEAPGGLPGPSFETMTDALTEAAKLRSELPKAWFWIWDNKSKCKVLEFEQGWD